MPFCLLLFFNLYSKRCNDLNNKVIFGSSLPSNQSKILINILSNYAFCILINVNNSGTYFPKIKLQFDRLKTTDNTHSDEHRWHFILSGSK